MNISIDQARRIAIHAQFLDGRTQFPKGKEGVAAIIEKLGYIQIDTISVVERAHHHTLWARHPDYHPKYLHDLQALDKRIFEYWGHAASFLPIDDYRFYLHRMKTFSEPNSKWEQERYDKCGDMMGHVLEKIQTDGAIASRDLEAPEGKRKEAGWWEWKSTKIALEILFWRGQLMVKERKNFQRVYDLAERVLPSSVDTSEPTNEELGMFCVRRALSSLGIAGKNDIADHIRAAGKTIIISALKKMVKSGEVIEVSIDGKENKDYYMLSQNVEHYMSLSEIKPQLHILSPFDNFVILRERIKDLFDFDYTIECYTPVHKRKYGYFTLPILWSDKLIGRMDAKAERKAKTLIVRNLVFEPGFKDFRKILSPFKAKLKAFTKFNHCAEIVVEKTDPVKFKGMMEK